MKEKILFVCQRYGLEINGGAEMECRAYAEHMQQFYEVEALTTCAVDYMTWKNEYPMGDCTINGVLVHRFLNEKQRDVETFNRISNRLVNKHHSFFAEEKWIDAQGPYCRGAISFLKKHGSEYKAVIFMTYLYYLTVRGLLPQMKNAILIPTAHDEPPIYYRCYDKVFSAARGFIYNTSEEQDFVETRFPSTKGKPSCTVGYGIDPNCEMLPEVKKHFGITGGYILYAGRIDISKGCKMLFDYFCEYKRRYPSDLKLILVGKSVIPIPARTDIQALGFVSEAEKNALMKNAEALVLASPFESLSIVVLESMMMGRPVLVNGACAVLKGHCKKSNAGLYFEGVDEFCGALEYLLKHPEICSQMGENGQKYIQENYQWDSIVNRMHKLIQTL